MDTLIGLAMIASQVIAIVKSFGGMKNTPKWLDISVGIGLVIMLLAIFGFAMNE